MWFVISAKNHSGDQIKMGDRGAGRVACVGERCRQVLGGEN